MTSNQDENNKENKVYNHSKISENNKASVNKKSYDDEIELRQLIMVLWNRKVLIIVITLIFALLAGIYSKFFITPVYKTSFSIGVTIPKIYNTKYGPYELPMVSNTEYINLIKSSEVIKETIKDLGQDFEGVSVQSISNRISFTSTDNGEQSIFNVNVSGYSPQETVDLANALYYNYAEYIDLMLKSRAINYYHDFYSIDLDHNQAKIESNKDLLERYEDLLETVPSTINQKAAMEAISDPNGYIVLENIINPNHTALEFRILEIKQEIATLESANERYTAYIEELTEDMAKLEEYYQADGVAEFDSNLKGNVEVFRLSEPLIPGGKSSPNVTKNIVIAGVLGGMVSVFVAFFMAYWKREI